MLSLYRRLIELRRGSPALSVGAYRQIYVDDGLLVYARQHADQELIVGLNFSDAARELPSVIAAGRHVILSTHLDGGEPGGLRPNEGVLLE